MFSCSCLVQLPASFLATGPLTSQAQADSPPQQLQSHGTGTTDPTTSRFWKAIENTKTNYVRILTKPQSCQY